VCTHAACKSILSYDAESGIQQCGPRPGAAREHLVPSASGDCSPVFTHSAVDDGQACPWPCEKSQDSEGVLQL